MGRGRDVDWCLRCTDRVVAPLARLKDEGGQLRVPYSKQRIGEAPEVEGGDAISADSDRLLRDYYGIDAGDQETRSDNESYATRVPEEAGAADRIEDPTELETPDADTRTDETMQRRGDPGSSETRKVNPRTWPTTTRTSSTIRTAERG